MTGKPASHSPPPQGYTDWLADLQYRIHTAQQRAMLAVNRKLVLVYWQIGRDILARQTEQGLGAKVIDRLAHYLRTAFAEMKGFSRTNLVYMRSFAKACPDEQVALQAAGQLPWGDHLVLLARLNNREEQLADAQKTIEQIERELRKPSP